MQMCKYGRIGALTFKNFSTKILTKAQKLWQLTGSNFYG